MKAIILTVAVMIGMTLTAQIKGLENYRLVNLSSEDYMDGKVHILEMDMHLFEINSDTYPTESSISIMIEELERILVANDRTLDSYESSSTEGVDLTSIDISQQQLFINAIFFDYVIGDYTISFITRDLNVFDNQEGFFTGLMIHQSSMYD